MNRVVTSKEEILQASRELLKEQGWTAINIRAVAAACHVSVGSIYNYFGSKADLVSNTVESVWHEIFHEPVDKAVFADIQSCVSWIFERMAFGGKEYPGFFTLHSMNFMSEDKEDGKKKMQKTWKHIHGNFCHVMQHDPNIRADAFDESFTPEHFADVLFSMMLSALIRQDYNPETALQLIKRTLY